MGVLDNIFGSDSGSAVPGGNISKPLIIALMALLASRYFSGGKASSTGATPPESADETSPGTILDGLGGLLKQFQQNGLGEVVNSWIGSGPNKTITADQVTQALGPDTIDALAKRTGLSPEQIRTALSQLLPNAVDRLTPQGRLPSTQEINRLAS